MRVSKKKLSLTSILLFLIPFFTIIICLENHSSFKNENFFPFFDGKVSISLVGRQFYNVFLFKFSFFIYGLVSVLFYFLLGKHLDRFQMKNNMNVMGLVLNILLFIYLVFLGDNIIQKPISVEGDDLMVQDEFVGNDEKVRKAGKVSVSITYSKDNVSLGHTGINIIAGDKAPGFAYSSNLNKKQVEYFMTSVIDYFNSEVQDQFVATTKVIV